MLFIFDNILSFQTIVGDIDGEEQYSIEKHEEVMVQESRDKLRPRITMRKGLMNNCVPHQQDGRVKNTEYN